MKKILIFLMTLSSATIAHAATQNIYCSGGMNSFNAVVTTNSDSVSVKSAHILGAFIQADLNCSNDRNITGVHCAGYLNDRILIEGRFDQTKDQTLLFSFKSPTNGSVKSDQPWTCQFE